MPGFNTLRPASPETSSSANAFHGRGNLQEAGLALALAQISSGRAKTAGPVPSVPEQCRGGQEKELTCFKRRREH